MKPSAARLPVTIVQRLFFSLSTVAAALTQGQWKTILRQAEVKLDPASSASILTALNNALDSKDDNKPAAASMAARTTIGVDREEIGGGPAKLAAQRLLSDATDTAWGEVAAMINPSNIMFGVGSILLLVAYAVLVGSKLEKARSSDTAQNFRASVTIMAYTIFFMACFEAMGSSMVRREHSELVGGILLLAPPLMAPVLVFNLWSALFGLTSEKLEHWGLTVVSELVSDHPTPFEMKPNKDPSIVHTNVHTQILTGVLLVCLLAFIGRTTVIRRAVTSRSGTSCRRFPAPASSTKTLPPPPPPPPPPLVVKANAQAADPAPKQLKRPRWWLRWRPT